eukprot:2964500-Prorocentrum_lima.AAC.1
MTPRDSDFVASIKKNLKDHEQVHEEVMEKAQQAEREWAEIVKSARASPQNKNPIISNRNED